MGINFKKLSLNRCIAGTLAIYLIYAMFSKYSYSPTYESDVTYVEATDLSKMSSLRFSLEDMIRLKNSVSMELRDLELKRRKILDELTTLTKKVNETRAEILKVQVEKEKVYKSLEQAKVMRLEAMEKNTPELAPPLHIVPQYDKESKYIFDKSASQCRLDYCFDFSQCPLTEELKVFLYPVAERAFVDTLMWQKALESSGFITKNPEEACLYFVVNLNKDLTKLAHWRGDGRNHVVIDLNNKSLSSMSRAIYARQYSSSYRKNYDIVLPFTKVSSDILSLPPLSPARRKYLLSFQGEVKSQSPEEQIVISVLKKLQLSTTDDKFLIHFKCINNVLSAEEEEYALCGTYQSREEILKESTFSLILSPQDFKITSTKSVQQRLYESLKFGAIPVILGYIDIPFQNEIDWSRAAIIMPKARATEVHYLLRTISDADVLSLRRFGRIIWDKYFKTAETVVATMLSALRDTLRLFPSPLEETPSLSVFNSTFNPLKTDPPPSDEEIDEYLGPIEPPLASPKFVRNYTYTTMNSYERWNVMFEPFHLFQNTPFDPVVPTEARFVGSSNGFRPVNGGAGGAGKEFSEVIGGNRPREQFTVVMLAYERDQVMIASLGRLNEVPYLNKVIVVWNSRQPPAEDLQWPDIGVPIVVVKTEKNSLNNRFLPFDEIETEAILSVDDDVHLRHDEIVFGFRVWREQRDRIVGFPGRFHAWDPLYGGWHYNSNYSCELSMVLTGAAFFHKYYSYLYTYAMPQEIREKVDEYMNCEDLAMNFLVSHYTRQPPVKVTNRWTFRCPGCPVTLSEDETHFEERHKCMNFFTQVYGYMPLLNTQFRVDSVLSKTRIPHDKQKCFKYV
ncbi:hypothetical protein QYM36_001122 [Artemia franciscana]|uniref:glucuronosyl-galactosyl-proteoglycan 4-alpha-N-acetylglucosaminyltransferase n=1 Tax=Artemia franciscana TaxID=6661 RepID=A0AA88LF99_ARTSF|nr:hypothetical protein QYM36_001122 [Artemia franciscana]